MGRRNIRIEMAARHHFGKRFRIESASGGDAGRDSAQSKALPDGRFIKIRDKTAERIYRIMVRQGIVVEEYDEIMKESDNFSITIP